MEFVTVLYALGVFAAGVVAKRFVDGKPPIVPRDGRAPAVVGLLDWLRAMAVKVSGGQQPAPVPTPGPTPNLPAMPSDPMEMLKKLINDAIDAKIAPLLKPAPQEVFESAPEEEYSPNQELLSTLRRHARRKNEDDEIANLVHDLASRYPLRAAPPEEAVAGKIGG